MTASQLISGKILTLVAQGMDLRAAFNEVLGEGAYEQLASDLYDQLRGEG